MPDTKLIRTFKYRLYPTRSQVAALELHLSEGCRLYNAALQERREAWRFQRKSISFYAQSRQLKDIRAAGDIGIPSFTTAEKVLRRVDRAFQAFFRRLKAGERPGYPRFRSVRRYDSISCKVKDGISVRPRGFEMRGVGLIKAKWHRPMVGTPKTVDIKREGGHWYACVALEGVPAMVLAESDSAVGIDVGLTTFATLSDGSVLEHWRHERSDHAKTRRVQRAVQRCKRGSQRRRRVVQWLAAQRRRTARRRSDWQHKASRLIVNSYGRIAIESLNIRGLARTRLARSVHDAAWASFIEKLTYKAESAGRTLVKVSPYGTSQTCLCGARVEKTLDDREHVCTACGLVAPRDLVSAQLIERLGRSRWASTSLTGAVAHEA